MSDLSVLVNNFELIRQHQQEIMNYAPYRFSRIRFQMMKPYGKYAIGDNFTHIYGSYLGSYLMIWENYFERWSDHDVIPLYTRGSPFSGYVTKFAGYSRSSQKLVREKPEGFTTGSMLHYVGKFRREHPLQELAVPLEQVVAELKAGRPVEHRESFQLLTLRDYFRRTVKIITGIDASASSAIKYNVIQNRHYKPVLIAEAVLQIELTGEERRRSTFNGTAVVVADMMIEAKERIRLLASSLGFEMWVRTQQHLSVASLVFHRELDHDAQVLETETINNFAELLHQVNKQRTRF